MHLISCKNCGIVLDGEILNFPKEIEKDDGSIDIEKASWNSLTQEFLPYVKCPVCKSPIQKEN